MKLLLESVPGHKIWRRSWHHKWISCPDRGAGNKYHYIQRESCYKVRPLAGTTE